MAILVKLDTTNIAGDNPYIFDCPWCGALKGSLCRDEDGNESTDGSYHRARLMKDCLGIEETISNVEVAPKSNMELKYNARLKSLIKEKALLIGTNEHFKLASGDKSNYFFDMKLISMDPEGSELIANAILELLQTINVDYIGGLESGAIPIVAIIANKSLQTKKPIPAFFVRKTPKERGTNKMIEGNLTENSNVVLVDDVTTTGESVLFAVRKVRELNCHVDTVITIVDRLSGAKETLAKENIQLISLFTKNYFNCVS